MTAPNKESPQAAYAERLARLQGRWWKRLLDVQRPYRCYLRRLELGFVLDVGCGIGRSLTNAGGQGVGVDINPHAVAVCKAKGLHAYIADDFFASKWAKASTFDSLVLAHVVEHMNFAEALALLRSYLPFLKAGGRVVLIAPQEMGFKSDPTHVEPFDLAALTALLTHSGLQPAKQESFPLPRAFGHVFPYNEFIVIGKNVASPG